MIDKNTFGSRTALFHTFGCKLNFAETSTVARIFASRGIQRVHEGDTPDYIVINSCSVTEVADKKCRQAVRSFARRYPHARIIVTGCYAQLKPDEVKTLPGVAVVAGTDRKLELADYLDRVLAEGEEDGASTFVTPTKEIRKFSPSCSRGDRTRYFLKVQDGCDYFCSYCTIPFARGRSRSGSIAEIVAQARDVAAEGGKEIVITGVNTGDFGKGTDETFLDLCRELDKVEGIERYRISSIEPNLLTDELIDFVASSRRFMPHFHIPLQSGSDDVLKLMRRRYDTALFREKIEYVRRVMPDAFIGVDLIVGARGETIERFEESRAFVDSLPISRLHVFTYSERPGTRALEIEHEVSQEEKHRRTRIMLAISERKLREFTERFVGTVRPILAEHPRHDGSMAGFTDNYLRINIAPQPELSNTICPVRITSMHPEGEESEGEVVG
ncbi:tRNA (N(6)-L-threonylcarbamoyladenosine(37)-C(2))-methylthiotransferase MtaB [uncultured Duncaniella sp.]|uniref:tRNA (N(6)-L-threonylcarbamoyladenosine(37)-C(2))- methylthiotransferase MtaB n=1 Tax=uncultured Duncaniella sp. TaxID=2768039 RepID=UPI002618D9C6|nr:tRNA (N(6)-L-threonylcarbamoyladenosine(37)-C(2))-methylthiotransferase MtaB [uncultured Duncaniella sp.]